MKTSTAISLVIVLLLAGGWFYIKRYTHLLSKNYQYYGYYDDVRGLQGSDPVFVRGVKVGHVDEVELTDQRKVRVRFSIGKDTRLTQGTVAIIGSGELTGSKSVRLIPGETDSLLPPEGVMRTGIDTSLTEDFHSRVTPALHNGKYLLQSFDTALLDFDYILAHGWGIRTQQEILKFRNNTGKWANASFSANGGTAAAGKSITLLDSMTRHVVAKTANLDSSLQKADLKLGETARKPLKDEVQSLQKSLNRLGHGLQKTGETKLIRDKTLYTNAGKALDTFNRSMDTYKQNPGGLSIFGGKKK